MERVERKGQRIRKYYKVIKWITNFLIDCDILKVDYHIGFRKQVSASRVDAERDGVVVPTTMEEYCMKAKPNQSDQVL